MVRAIFLWLSIGGISKKSEWLAKHGVFRGFFSVAWLLARLSQYRVAACESRDGLPAVAPAAFVDEQRIQN